jgi:hypothetical protein
VTTVGHATFHAAFLDARRRIAAGDDPEQVVPAVLELAEADEEIRLAERLYGDATEGDDGDG